jgi:hypothetical protein
VVTPVRRAAVVIAILSAVLVLQVVAAGVRHQESDVLLAELRAGRSDDPVQALFRLAKRDEGQYATRDLIREILAAEDRRLAAFVTSSALVNLGYPELERRPHRPPRGFDP